MKIPEALVSTTPVGESLMAPVTPTETTPAVTQVEGGEEEDLLDSLDLGIFMDWAEMDAGFQEAILAPEEPEGPRPTLPDWVPPREGKKKRE